eukprot:TRINITY_DN3660_c4_g1_i1.p1 TRINITY_DN3660_c4_g1~~TRINITY_DN3660_c4_g1_i1.p1  ORF type:complete len:606 (+),score=185.51 TRINITY_DN3660_c4_g1_i1:53-1870(+)
MATMDLSTSPGDVRNDSIVATDDSLIGDADEMVTDDIDSIDMEQQIAALRGEKLFLEYRNAELEEEVNNMRGNQVVRSQDDDATIQSLEQEILLLKQGIEEAKTALDDTISENQELHEKLKTNDAVFNERKRNFDHIITIFGEEKKTIVDAKAEAEEKLKAAEEEIQKLKTADTVTTNTVDETSILEINQLKDRVDELETMLGQSGLARQDLEDKLTSSESTNISLQDKLESAEAQLRLREDSNDDKVRSLTEESKSKSKEIIELKAYVGKKSLQWEQYKEEASKAKKALEDKFESRSRELEAMQNNLEKYKSESVSRASELSAAKSEIKNLKSELESAKQEKERETRHSSLDVSKEFGDTELVGLLEEKEQVIESLATKLEEVLDKQDEQQSNADNERKMADEMSQLINKNKSLEDEVMGLKSLVFKLEHKGYSQNQSGNGLHRSNTHRAVSPSFQRSTSTGRNGSSLRFPSPTHHRSAVVSSPSTRPKCTVPHAASVSKQLASKIRALSPSGRVSPNPRAISPSLSRRGSMQSNPSATTKRPLHSVVMEERRKGGSSPIPRGSGYQSASYSSPSVSARSSRSVGRKPSAALPLSSRPVNCGNV